MPRRLSSYLQWGHIFPEKWGEGGRGRQDRQFPSLISEHYKQWSYLSIIDTKAASGKGMGTFSAGNIRLPRGICERKTATKCRMGM